MSPELIDICIDNSSKIFFIKEVENLSQEQCNRFVKRLPNAISIIPDGYKTKKMAIEVTEIDPELIIHIPNELANRELCKKLYKKVSIKTKKKLIESGKMDGLVTSDMLKELIEDGIVFKKYSNHYISNFWDKIPKEIIDLNIANKIIEADSDCISIIPQEIVTTEMCEKAVRDNKRNIANIPKKISNFNNSNVSNRSRSKNYFMYS